MPGVGQVWLTQEELDALLRAASDTHTRVSEQLWTNLGPKLKDARDALGCPLPVPARTTDWPPAEPSYGGY